MDKIKFDEIYDGEWPYSSHDGVGVHFIGTPNDEVKFVEILQVTTEDIFRKELR